MKVEILSRKFIKPSVPTPLFRQNYTISLTDELALPSNVPIILYYPGSSATHDILSRCHHLEKSLALTLTTYYPFAGRYIKDIRSVDCNDQGVGYVQAKANIQLHEILGNVVKPDVLNDLLPCELGAIDEINDPLLSVQITMFDCGGLAVAMCFSHRISDMGGFSAFITSWACSDADKLEISSIFNTPTLFPPRGLPELELRAPRTRTGIENDAKMFLFDKKAISGLRAKAGITNSRFSKVQLVFGLLYKAIVHGEVAKSGGSKASHVILPTNLRDKIVPPLPKEAFGNLWGLGTVDLNAGKGDKMELGSYVKLMNDSIRKFRKDCTKIQTHGEEAGYEVVINPFLKSNELIADSKVNFYLFTSWCRFPFYHADFGWGKPIWASSANLPLQNWVTLMDDKDGDGVEAWVYLDEKDMLHLQQDSDLRAFACTTNW